jgi:chemotaxis signal transduction protein
MSDETPRFVRTPHPNPQDPHRKAHTNEDVQLTSADGGSKGDLTSVEIVLFEINGTRYGADMSQVRRIDRFDSQESVGAPLGVPRVGKRALIFNPSGHREHHLAIDSTSGVQRISSDALRRLPNAVQAAPFILGAYLDQDVAILLIDLHATVPLLFREPHA